MDISTALHALIRGVERRKAHHLRKLSDTVIAEFLISENRDYLLIAILCYVLSKMLEKHRYRDDLRQHHAAILWKLHEASRAYDARDYDSFRNHVQELTDFLEHIEREDKRFVRKLVDKARTKVAAHIYAAGFSLSYAAEMVGIQKHALLDYIGATVAADRVEENVSIFQRLSFVEELQ